MVLKLMLASAAAMAVRTLPLSAGTVQPLVSAPVEGMEMKPSPIEPSWIIEGEPQARIAEHSWSADEAAMTAIWDCTAGHFRWYFHWDETVVILEGEVHVTTEDGSERVLRTGDIGYFSGRTWATWRVDDYVKKIAFVRKPFPVPVAMAYRLANFLRSKPPRGFAG
ncbi:cupin domain-containing protein [Rhizobium sp. LjRoot30]|uniref:cupin domain-containing protein n=1 Tax=Rhizobium sp. LjRoot30 TaxID=3342320 RepID=UPI003ECD10F3